MGKRVKFWFYHTFFFQIHSLLFAQVYTPKVRQWWKTWFAFRWPPPRQIQNNFSVAGNISVIVIFLFIFVWIFCRFSVSFFELEHWLNISNHSSQFLLANHRILDTEHSRAVWNFFVLFFLNNKNLVSELIVSSATTQTRTRIDAGTDTAD